MKSDPFQQAWQVQAPGRMMIDAESLFREVRRNQQSFTLAIAWRDCREVGTALVLVPVWVFMGVKQALHWTWYLMVPSLLGVAGFLLLDRIRHRSRAPEPGDPLRRCVADSLAAVEHQIWLLRRVGRWYLLPLAVPAGAFLGQVAWQTLAGGWWLALFVALVAIPFAIVFAMAYWMNQIAVRTELEPRRQELALLLQSLDDEPSEGGAR